MRRWFYEEFVLPPRTLSLSARVLLYLAALVVVAFLPLDPPWPLLIAAAAYLAILFPALVSKTKLESKDRCPACGAVLTEDDGIAGRDSRYFQCANGHRMVLRQPPSLAHITGSLHGAHHPEMEPPPSWWSGEQWRAALALVAQCRCDPFDCGPYGHDPDCPAGVLSQGQYNAVKGRLPTISRRPL